VCFEKEVEARKVQYGEGHGEEACPDALSGTLLTAYCILRDAPDSCYFGSGTPKHATRSWVRSWWQWKLPSGNRSQRRLLPRESIGPGLRLRASPGPDLWYALRAVEGGFCF
jgi:hypothetical protein